MAKRVYAVESNDEITLVKTNSPARALGHVAKGQFTVRTASAVDVLEYLEAGGVVEDPDESNGEEEEGEGDDQTEGGE